MREPIIIQGGMGMGVSNWQLARAVSKTGHLGVVSGTAIDTILVRRLQEGDLGGHMQRALAHFPDRDMADRIWGLYFIPGGKKEVEAYRNTPMYTLETPLSKLELCVVANFVEVFLAKEGHSGKVGINLLQKIALPNLPSLYGAMLAGVDYVLMGAGIPREIPSALDHLARHEKASMRIPVEGAGSDEVWMYTFDPKHVLSQPLEPLNRPKFLAIIASTTLAVSLARHETSPIDGFVIEGPLAGGHNAPPRGGPQLNARGEPVYGPRDEVDLDRIKALGKPFWLAGTYGHPEKLHDALRAGAAGIQVGTAFAFCDESGFDPDIKRRVLEKVRDGSIDVFTDPSASPTGFPFKVVRLEGSASESDVYKERSRVCDLGYLRVLYKKEDGSVGYRCPAEPIETYIKKGGRPEDAEGRKCLCNGLQAVIGLGQQQPNGAVEPPLVTAGDMLRELSPLLQKTPVGYSAADVITYLLAQGPTAVPA